MDLLLKKELVEFGIAACVGVANEIIEVVSYEDEGVLWGLLQPERVIHVQNRYDMSSVLFVHVLY